MSEAIRFTWERALRKRGLTGSGSVSAKYVGKTMAGYADAKTGEMYPGIAVLVKETGLGKKAVINALATLRKTGWIERVRKGNSRAGMSDVYRLTIPPLDQVSQGRPLGVPADLDQVSQGRPLGVPTDAYWVSLETLQETIEETIEQQAADQASGLATDQQTSDGEEPEQTIPADQASGLAADKEQIISNAWSDEVREAFRQGVIDEATAEGERRIKRVRLAMETSDGEEPGTDQAVGVGDEPWTDKEEAKIRSYQGMGMDFAKACEYAQEKRESVRLDKLCAKAFAEADAMLKTL